MAVVLVSQNDKNPPPGQANYGTVKKRYCKLKNWGQKIEKHVFFFTFRLPILDGCVDEQISSVVFFTMIFEGECYDLSKIGGFGRKIPPPGKPVFFYVYYPEDYVPAPSVRADFFEIDRFILYYRYNFQ